MTDFKFKSTQEIKISEKLVDQVMGQDQAVNIIKKAALQRRHVLLIGEPGTGKSMLGLALAELLPKEKLVDMIAFPNPNDENTPLIRTVPAGKGRELVARAKYDSMNMFRGQNIILFILVIFSMIAPWWAFYYYGDPGNVLKPLFGATKSEIFGNPTLGGLIFVALFLGGMFFLISYIIFINMGKRTGVKVEMPKIIVDNFKQKTAPFYDATGAHAGALLGDVLHDPFQSGGLGTPAHERVIAGMIHKAHNGVLFIDEVGLLQSNSQQELLTALQEGKFPITGQSERSAGAMVRTEPVPCKFVLVAAGNAETITQMHPALRSRIRGYGYEVYMNDTMPDTVQNQQKLAVFVAQEVVKDGRIPHFNKEAVEELIHEARRRANRKGRLTLRLRELGGLIRAAGDVAIEEKADLVTPEHIEKAKSFSISLEGQMANRIVEFKKEYKVIKVDGKQVGRVNGLAVLGSSSYMSGIVLPIEAEVTPGGKKIDILATGGLGDIAKEAIINVSAIIKKYFGEELKDNYDIFIQFLQEHGVEGDSASIACATAVISALKNVPVKQEYAMTGSLSVRGEVLPIGGVTYKIEAAIDAGIKKVIVPASNMKDIVIRPARLKLIEIIPVKNINEVLKESMDWTGNEDILKQIVKVKSGRYIPAPVEKGEEKKAESLKEKPKQEKQSVKGAIKKITNVVKKAVGKKHKKK